MEKNISYTTTNTYSTLNTLNDTTKNVWLVFHGIGYLSRYFIQLFKELNPEENYIIAPQAPSKYYKGNDYQRVGSSWLTKENTALETSNVLNYTEAVLAQEDIPEDKNLIILGYSQGVSIACRFMAKYKMKCSALVLISGAFPRELTKEDFSFFSPQTKAIHILGKKDPFIKGVRIEEEKQRLEHILPNIEFISHKAGHELDPKTLLHIL